MRLVRRAWPADELAGMLLGAVDENGSLLQSASFAFGCLARPLNQQRLTHAGIIQVFTVLPHLLQHQYAKPKAVSGAALLRLHASRAESLALISMLTI